MKVGFSHNTTFVFACVNGSQAEVEDKLQGEWGVTLGGSVDCKWRWGGGSGGGGGLGRGWGRILWD